MRVGLAWAMACLAAACGEPEPPPARRSYEDASDLALCRCPGIGGVVTDASGAPVAGATVSARVEGAPVVLDLDMAYAEVDEVTTTTSAHGVFHLDLREDVDGDDRVEVTVLDPEREERRAVLSSGSATPEPLPGRHDLELGLGAWRRVEVVAPERLAEEGVAVVRAHARGAAPWLRFELRPSSRRYLHDGRRVLDLPVGEGSIDVASDWGRGLAESFAFEVEPGPDDVVPTVVLGAEE